MNNSKRVKCSFFNVLFGALLVLVMSHSALAQSLASITGRVEDSSGAAISGVMVTVTSLETGASRSIAADDSGSYRVVSLVVGRYEVKAEKVGFKTAVQTGVSLTVGQQAVVNITLAVGQVDQQVTVTSEAPLVNTTTAPTSGLVEEKEVKDLPLNGRSFDSLIALNTGAYPVTSLKNSGAGAQSGNVFSISGRRYGENLFLLNGVEYMGPSQVHSTPGGVSGQLLGIDAVREFNVLTDTYSADFGKRAGGQINIVTMSGTNQLHGTLFEFVRNNVFDARNPIDPADLPKRIPPFKRNQFGGALGGPIKKDKTFVFGNYEGFRQRLGLSQTAFVPWKYFRLGQVPDANGNPIAVVAAPATLAKMEEFAANYWPLPTGPDLLSPTGIDTGVGPAVYNPLQSIREDMGIVRVDHTFSTKDTLGTTYLVDDGFNKNPQINPFWRMDSDIRSQVLSLQETHIFSAHLINNFTTGFSRASFFFVTPPNDGVNIPSDLILIKGQLPGRLTIGGGGNTSGGSISAAGSTIASNRSSFRNAFTYADNVQIIKGRHQISVGAWFERLQSNEFAPGNQAGVAVFGTLTTFLQGTVQSFAATPSAIRMYWRQLEGAWYVQDNIQVRPNLTVQIGLRHEFNDGYNEAQDHATNYYLVNGVFKTAPVVGSSIYAVNNAVKLFGPRVGIAWDPFGKGKTSVRAGFGTHFSMHDTLNTLDSNPPFNGTLNFTNQAFLPLIPIDPATPLAPTCGPGVPGSVTAAGGTVPGGTCSLFAPGGINQNAKTPTVEEWNFSVEQGFGSNMSLRVSYVGSHGFHLVQSDNGNVIPPQTCAAAAGCPAGGLGSAASIAGSMVPPTGTQYIPVTPKGNVPNPYVGAAGYLGDYGVSSYNAMSVEFTRRFSAGLQFKANYTWAKELDISDGYSGDPGVGNLQDYWNPIQSGYGLSGNNQKGRFVFSGGYELPIGKNKPFLSGVTGVADKLATGWQVNTIVTALTGFPFGPTTGINRSGNTTSGAGSDRPSYNPNFTGPIVTGNPNQWFNANAFILPAAGTFGNVPKNTLIGPNLRNVDISIFKTTTITERVKLQFRAEGFNVLNRSNWSNTVSGANSVFSGTPGTGLACFPSPAATGPTAGLTPCGGATTVSGSAGTIQSTATTSRQFQFGLKLIF